jgi:hypothetical protein
LNYMTSDKFQPGDELSVADLRVLFQ